MYIHFNFNLHGSICTDDMDSQANLLGGPTWPLTSLHGCSFSYPEVNRTNKETALRREREGGKVANRNLLPFNPAKMV